MSEDIVDDAEKTATAKSGSAPGRRARKGQADAAVDAPSASEGAAAGAESTPADAGATPAGAGATRAGAAQSVDATETDGDPDVETSTGPDGPGTADGEGFGGLGGDDAGRPPVKRRSAALGVALAVVGAIAVLVGSGIGYFATVPNTHTVPSRLNQLAPTESGLANFKGKPATMTVPASQAQVAAFSAAAKKSPKETALFTAQWTPSQTAVAGIGVYLLANDSEATSLLPSIVKQSTGATVFNSDGYNRKSTFAIPNGGPGSTGALFVPGPQAQGGASAPQLATAAFRVGRTVAVIQVVTAGAQPDLTSLATTEQKLLAKVEPGFKLSTTSYATGDTIGWAAGTIAIAAIVGLSPLWVGALRRRRQRRRQAELDRRVVVGSQVINKRRI